jgi:tRNA (Thr-GGU) A37 N-methylase
MGDRTAPRPDGGFRVEPIGHVDSPIVDPGSAPRQPDEGAPPVALVLRPERPAIDGFRASDEIIVLTWLHRAGHSALRRRTPATTSAGSRACSNTRSPERPNPIGLYRTTIVAIEGTRIEVDHLDALARTTAFDIKPALGAQDRRKVGLQRRPRPGAPTWPIRRTPHSQELPVRP